MIFTLVMFLLSTPVYERAVTISYPEDSVETDVQVKLKLDTRFLIDAGKLDSQGAGLRFFRRETPIPHCILDTIHSCSTLIWLRMDSLFPGESELTMFYADSNDSYGYLPDSVFTKATVDSGKGWIFHLDEGEGKVAFPSSCSDFLTLQGTTWEEDDGGGFGGGVDRALTSGSSLRFAPGSFASWEVPQEALRDSFSMALWLKFDTAAYLAYSSLNRTVISYPEHFHLAVQLGNISFSIKNASSSRACLLPPFGWEDAGSPDLPSGFIPQGMSTAGSELLFSAYRTDPPISRVWRISPQDLTLLDWFDMPEDATHTSGLAYDSTTGILWVSDYDSDKLYALEVDSSFAVHQAVVKGSFKMYRNGVSACCIALYKDTSRLVISTFGEEGRTYVVDEQTSLLNNQAVVLGSYVNTRSSQGLAFDGRYLWESSNNSLVQLDLEKAIQGRNIADGIVALWPEPLLVEDLAFLDGVLWTSTESVKRSFYRLTGNPWEFLGRWIHIAVTFDGKNLKLYRNGKLTDSVIVHNLQGASTSSLFLGGTRDGGDSFEGSIDELLFLPRVMDENEIMALFERRKALIAEPSFYLQDVEDTLPDFERMIGALSEAPWIGTSSSSLILVTPYEREIRVDLFDISGRRIATLLPAQKVRGKIRIPWPQGIPNGVYFAVMNSEGEGFSRKVVLLR